MALRTLGDLIDGLAKHGDAEAIIGHHPSAQVVWTRQQLHDEILGFAACLVEAGVTPGEPVGLFASARPEWPAAMLAIARVGAVAMPLPEQMVGSELVRILVHSGCRHMITTARHVKMLAALEGADKLMLILLDDAKQTPASGPTVHNWRKMPQSDQPLPELKPDQPAVLVYTSGTTGDPKGVPLTHNNLCTNIEALLSARVAGRNDRLLTPLPLHHVYPLTVGMLSPLAAGATMVIPAGITGPEISRALLECRCTLLIGVPRLYEAMLEGIDRKVAAYGKAAQAVYRRLLDLSTWLLRRFGWRIGRTLFAPLHRQVGPALDVLASGGAPLKPETAWRLGGLGWEVLVGYGLSETSPILTFNARGRTKTQTGPAPPRRSVPPAYRSRASNSGSPRCRTSSPILARSRPAAPACSPAIGTIPRPPRRPSPTTASSAPAISATSTTTAFCSSLAAARR
jgi:long-chain acyl-CoA synthetase